MDTVAFIFGLTIVVLVVVQLVVVTSSSFYHLARQRQHNILSKVLMHERIEAATELRARHQRLALSWNGYRKFVVNRKEPVADNVCSVNLVPHDNKPLPGFLPGQYLTFQLDIPGHDKPVVRCYSLSDSPGKDYYRVTIKRVGPTENAPDVPHGICSNYFHDHVNEGDILDVKAPGGHFVLDLTLNKPAVLIGGGVGVTPFLSMVNAIAESGSDRETWLFYGIKHGNEHVMGDHLRRLKRENDNIHIVVVYSRPRPVEIRGAHYDHTGHINVDILKQHLPTNNHEFFICGAPPMMQSLTKQLKQWGVPKNDIHTEAFGPATIKAKGKAIPPVPKTEKPSPKANITFSKSGKTVPWDDGKSNILELAVESGVKIDNACCAGSCGTCQVAVKSGNITYDDQPEWEVEAGCCLTCVGRPKGDVVLDA